MNPGIEQLRRLCRFGFHGERLFNQDGHLDLVHYTRDFWGVREVVLVYSAGKALAYRTRDMLDPDSPLHITDNAVEWRLHGDVVTVVNALLSLPTPGAPRNHASGDRPAPDQPSPVADATAHPATRLPVADPQFSTTTPHARTRLSGPGPLAASGPDPRDAP